MAIRGMLPFLLLLLAFCAYDVTAQTCNQAISTPNNGQPYDAGCAGSVIGTRCNTTCDAGFTGQPLPYAVCVKDTGVPAGASWSLRGGDGFGNCLQSCPSSPPTILNANFSSWTQIWSQVQANIAGSTAGGLLDPSISCEAGNTGEESFCIGACTAGSTGTATAKCVNVGTLFNPVLDWVTTSDCTTTACVGNPSTFNNTAFWPSSCSGQNPVYKCDGGCQLPYGTALSGGIPHLYCRQNATALGGADWDTAISGGTCVRVCTEPVTMWMRNTEYYAGVPAGQWPAACDRESNGVGGRAAGQWCNGVCTAAGWYGTPKWVCGASGRFKFNRTGDCFPVREPTTTDPAGPTGGCFGPATERPPANSLGWDSVSGCWDLRRGWNCTSECVGNWTANPSDPKAIGYASAEMPVKPTIRCLYNASNPPYYGSYQPSVGQCVPVCRGPLPLLPNVQWDATCLPVQSVGGRRINGSLCIGTCVGGTVGSIAVPCTNSGWGQVIGGCSTPGSPATTCLGAPGISQPANALAWPPTCTNLAINTNCTTTCNPTVSSGLVWATGTLPYLPYTTCKADGNWTRVAVGTCARVCASSPPITANVIWPAACTVTGGIGGVPMGGSCVGQCDTNYVGSPRSTCAASGSPATYAFTAVAIGCQPKSVGYCAGRPTAPVTSGAFACNYGWGGQVCAAKCNPGYGSATMPTTPTVTCNINASLADGAAWSPTATGQCIRVCTVPIPPNANVTWPADCVPDVNGVGGRSAANGVCSGTCVGGRVPAAAGGPRILCQSGSWGGLITCV